MPGTSSVASVATLCYKTEVYSSDETEFPVMFILCCCVGEETSNR